MRQDRLYIAVATDDGRAVHAIEACGNYATLCSISTDDDETSGRQVPLVAGDRITCRTCIAIIRLAKQYRESDFAKG